MRSNTTTRTFSILVLLTIIGLSTSCSKEHDLVSDFVVVASLGTNSNTTLTSSQISIGEGIEKPNEQENTATTP